MCILVDAMNVKEPLVNFLKSVLNNVNLAFQYRISRFHLQLLQETNVLRFIHRRIERWFGLEPKTEPSPYIKGEEDQVICRVDHYIECSKYELIDLKAKEIQMHYEKMVFEMTQELKGDKRVFSLIAQTYQSSGAERVETGVVSRKHERRYSAKEIQTIPLRFKPIRLKRRIQPVNEEKIDD